MGHACRSLDDCLALARTDLASRTSMQAARVLVPMLNQGESAVLFCFIFLFLAAAGAGAWAVDTMRAAPRA